MSDIVERLRAWHAPGETITGDVQLYLDAADEITRLREQVRSLHSLAYAPDGKEMRKALFEEAEKRGNAEAEVARLGILVERQRSGLSEARADLLVCAGAFDELGIAKCYDFAIGAAGQIELAFSSDDTT